MSVKPFSYIIGLWIVFLISFISPSALAHAPYLEKLAILEDDQGNQYILEKVYGDGVVLADPYRFQIRNLNGAILGMTKSEIRSKFDEIVEKYQKTQTVTSKPVVKKKRRLKLRFIHRNREPKTTQSKY